jgi:hypothetical protein
VLRVLCRFLRHQDLDPPASKRSALFL